MLNPMCKNCPRFRSGYVMPENESWYDSHYCAGTENETWTGCIRRPCEPLAVLHKYFDVENETWKDKVYNPVTKQYEIPEQN